MILAKLTPLDVLLNPEWLKICAISCLVTAAAFGLIAIIVKIAKPFEIVELDDEEDD